MKSQSTTPLLSEAQNIEFAVSASALVNGTDFNFRGNDINAAIPDTFVLDGVEAVKNKVMLWLYSDTGDYVREPLKGGPLTRLLGKPLNPEYAAEIDLSLRTSFQTVFANELNLALLQVEPNAAERRWDITMYVSDPLRRDLFKLALGVKA